MGRIMDSTGEMIGTLCPGLTATRSCKSTDFPRHSFFSRLVALSSIDFRDCFESSSARMMMGIDPTITFHIGAQKMKTHSARGLTKFSFVAMFPTLRDHRVRRLPPFHQQ